jgi:hypothetical protein
VDTEGLVLKAKVHSAISPQPGWLEVASGLSTHSGVAPVKHLWLDAGYEGRDKQWVEEVLGLPGCRDRPPRPPKPIPEEVARGCYELDQEWLGNAESGGPRGSGPTGESAFQCGFHPSS